MPRTADQVAADEALTEAIKAAMIAYEMDTGLITDYVVAIAAHHFDDDGESCTSYARLYRENAMPHYRILGLLRAVTMEVERSFHEDDRAG
jgi:hypothetical protein